MRSFVGALFDKTPVPFVSTAGRGLFGLGATKYNAEVQMRTMGSVSTLFAIVSRLASTTSQVDWKLYRKSDSGRDEDRVEVTRHLALQVWNKPNKFYTRQEFVESFQQHEDLVGEAWWVIGRTEGTTLPLELWPVRPDRMEPVPHPTEYLEGYIYNGPNGEKIPLTTDEVIQIRLPNPLDPYRGMGPVQSLMIDLDSVRYSAEWNRNFFINGAEPGGLIELGGTRLGDAQFRELRDRWNEQHKGVSNAHRVALLETGKWVDRKYSMRDMQFTELRNQSREFIREAFGFPKPLLGSVDDVNRANAEAAEVVFARWLIIPRLERIKQALNNDFLPLFGSTAQGLEFDYCNPVPDDREADSNELVARANAAKSLRDAGWNADDICNVVGLPDMRYEGRDNGSSEVSPTPNVA